MLSEHILRAAGICGSLTPSNSGAIFQEPQSALSSLFPNVKQSLKKKILGIHTNLSKVSKTIIKASH